MPPELQRCQVRGVYCNSKLLLEVADIISAHQGKPFYSISLAAASQLLNKVNSPRQQSRQHCPSVTTTGHSGIPHCGDHALCWISTKLRMCVASEPAPKWCVCLCKFVCVCACVCVNMHPITGPYQRVHRVLTAAFAIVDVAHLGLSSSTFCP